VISHLRIIFWLQTKDLPKKREAVNVEQVAGNSAFGMPPRLQGDRSQSSHLLLA